MVAHACIVAHFNILVVSTLKRKLMNKNEERITARIEQVVRNIKQEEGDANKNKIKK